MKLSNIVIDYRKRMQISQREFARRCGLSNSYISFIENEHNPRTGKPIVPTLEQYQKIATCMGMSLQHLFEMLDEDSPVELHSAPPDSSYKPIMETMSSQARIISGGVDRMPTEKRDQALKILQAAFVEYSDFFKEENK